MSIKVSEVIRTKCAVRQFTDEPLPEEAIRSILNAGRRAQSSKYTQPWHFIAIRDRATLRQLSQCGAYAGHLAGAPFAVALIASTPDSFDLGQAAAYLQLAAWELGIGSCIASMWEPEKAKAILGVPPINILMLQFLLVILFPTASSLTHQNQSGASRSMRWFSGNVGADK
jgi:nitroreductase